MYFSLQNIFVASCNCSLQLAHSFLLPEYNLEKNKSLMLYHAHVNLSEQHIFVAFISRYYHDWLLTLPQLHGCGVMMEKSR